jgi:hypothetical protein
MAVDALLGLRAAASEVEQQAIVFAEPHVHFQLSPA